MSQNIPYIFITPFLALFILFFLFTGCSHLGLIDSQAQLPHRDVERSYFPNGSLEYEAEFVNKKLDGTSRMWLEDGILLSVSEYTNGQPNGVWKTFHPNEKLKYETTFFHSQKHGYERWYYENGQLKSEEKFNFGEVETEIIRWNPDGILLY